MSTSTKRQLLYELVNELTQWFSWDRSLAAKFFQEFGTVCAFDDRPLRDFHRFVNEILKEIESEFAEDRVDED